MLVSQRDVGAGVRGVTRRVTRRATWRPRDVNDPAIVGRARTWARRILPGLLSRPARPDLDDDLDLVLSELVTNAIRHGGGCTRVEIRAVGRLLRLSVTDGRISRPVVHPTDRSARESGRGMLLVHTIARRWGVRRVRRYHGKSVWLELLLNP
jgi:anti-sigma regulatory factor (Ser/Thr protein kinase)